MKKFIIFLGIFAFFDAPLNGRAQSYQKFKDGNTILEVCQQNSQLFSQGFCNGYIQGVFDSLDEKVWGDMICIPPNITAVQLRDVVINFLYANPSGRHFDGSTNITFSLLAAFPCPKK